MQVRMHIIKKVNSWKSNTTFLCSHTCGKCTCKFITTLKTFSNTFTYVSVPLHVWQMKARVIQYFCFFSSWLIKNSRDDYGVIWAWKQISKAVNTKLGHFKDSKGSAKGEDHCLIVALPNSNSLVKIRNYFLIVDDMAFFISIFDQRMQFFFMR